MDTKSDRRKHEELRMDWAIADAKARFCWRRWKESGETELKWHNLFLAHTRTAEILKTQMEALMPGFPLTNRLLQDTDRRHHFIADLADCFRLTDASSVLKGGAA